MLSKIKNSIKLNAKHLVGWKTDRKIVVISVDDYGNVRLDSKEARANMDRAGLKVRSRFDAFDTLETQEDLEILYHTLMSVKDKNGSPAVFTPFAVPCNIDFEKMADTGYSEYHYECLPETFQKVSLLYPATYEGTWKLWKQGIESGIMIPQFHGREHLNLKVFEEKLKEKDHTLLTALKNRSFTSISSNGYKTISSMAAFDFEKFEENSRFDEIISDGLNIFANIFGYRAENFMAPAGREHPTIHNSLYNNGVRYLDTPLIKTEHQGGGNYKRVFNYTGKQNKLGQIFLVRNVVFEPTEKRNVDWVSFAMKQIEAAFRWNRPAIISSHRVNFCGFIDTSNRAKGIEALGTLLKKIVKRWPEVEFMSANNLGRLINKDVA